MVVITWSNDVMWFWPFFNMNCLEVCTQCPFVLPLPPPPSPAQLIASTTISLKKHISQTPIFHSYTQLPHTHHQHIFSQTRFSFHTLIRPDTQLIVNFSACSCSTWSAALWLPGDWRRALGLRCCWSLAVLHGRASILLHMDHFLHNRRSTLCTGK